MLDLVRGLPVAEARDVLAFTNRRATEPISKVLESAVANARHNHALDAEELFVVAAFADEGPTSEAVHAPSGPGPGQPHPEAHQPRDHRRRGPA